MIGCVSKTKTVETASLVLFIFHQDYEKNLSLTRGERLCLKNINLRSLVVYIENILCIVCTMFNRLSLQTAINSLRCKLITLAQICTVCSTHRPAKDTCGLSYFVRAANFKGSRVECSIFSARGGMRVEMF